MKYGTGMMLAFSFLMANVLIMLLIVNLAGLRFIHLNLAVILGTILFLWRAHVERKTGCY